MISHTNDQISLGASMSTTPPFLAPSFDAHSPLFALLVTALRVLRPTHISIFNTQNDCLATTHHEPDACATLTTSTQHHIICDDHAITLTFSSYPTAHRLTIPLVLQHNSLGSLILEFDITCSLHDIQHMLATTLSWILPCAILTHTAITHEYDLSTERIRTEQLQLETNTYNLSQHQITTRLLHAKDSSLSERQHHLTLLGQMAAGIAHDFNNTLTILLAQCHHLRARLTSTTQDPVTPSTTEALAQHERTIHDAADTIRRIRQSAISHDASTLTPIALNDLVNDVIYTTKPKWSDTAQRASTPILITTNLIPVPLCMGHPSQLRQAITNLLFNAVDAMPRGGTIHFVTTQHRDRIELRITDTGVGMDPHTAALAFEAFFSTKGAAGTGIGLTMVRDTVQRHGGTITIDSLPNHGTTVTIRLPTHAPLQSSNSAPPPLHPTPPCLNILVVDDHLELVDLLTELLRALGHTATGTTDPDVALRLATTTPIDLLLTDYSMSDISGLDLAAMIKRIHPSIPIILVTGWNDPLTTTPQQPNLITEILHKPYTPQQLKDTIASAWAATNPLLP